MQPGGMPDMQQIIEQAAKMQENLQRTQEELAATTVEGSAGGGLVTVQMTGTGELSAVTIDPKAVDPDDLETLQDLIVAAVRDGCRAAADKTREMMGGVAGGLGGLGGLDGLTGPGGFLGIE